RRLARASPPGRDEEALPALLAGRRGGIWPRRRSRRGGAMKRILLGVVGVALGLLAPVRAVDAAATRAEKCAAAELKAAGTKAAFRADACNGSVELAAGFFYRAATPVGQHSL